MHQEEAILIGSNRLIHGPFLAEVWGGKGFTRLAWGLLFQ